MQFSLCSKCITRLLVNLERSATGHGALPPIGQLPNRVVRGLALLCPGDSHSVHLGEVRAVGMEYRDLRCVSESCLTHNRHDRRIVELEDGWNVDERIGGESDGWARVEN